MHRIIFFILFLSNLNSQELGVGDTIPPGFGLTWCANNFTDYDSLYFDDYNGTINESGKHHVIWIMLFTSWCPYCENEVPYTQEFYEIYKDSGLVVLGIGADWGYPYFCDEWAESYGLSYPILDNDEDGDGDGGNEWNALNPNNIVPHNVIINHNMEIIYSSSGFPGEDGMYALLDFIRNALDECGPQCIIPCSGIYGDIDGTAGLNHEPIIDIMDLLRLADIVESGEGLNECIELTGDFTDDGIVNIVDLFTFASMLSEGVFDN